LLIFAVFIAVCASTAFVIFRLWSTGGPTEKRVTDETSSVESSR
jgi:hypothetical protein